jgi:hypothetical protein
MSSKERSLLSGRLGKTRRNSIWIKGRKEPSHPFFRNSPQGQPYFRELGKVEVGGKMPITPLMECWGCKENHRYSDCPHINYKVRVVHNV